jgi:uncharacterized protein with NRDE domain
MCTIAVLQGVHPGRPLAIVANRDELLDRPSTPPRVIHDAPRAIGGLDLVSGGTWMGANELGLFAAITNQRTAEPPDRTKKSRGPIVLRALASRSAGDVEVMLASLDAREHNPFNLVFGAPGDVRVAYGRDDRAEIEIERVPGPSVAIVTNDRLRSRELAPKIARAELRVAEALASSEDALFRALADHEKPPSLPDDLAPSRFPPEVLRELYALCVHLPFYGTVSSTVALWGADGRIERYSFAPGPPCVTPFDDVTSLLRGR